MIQIAVLFDFYSEKVITFTNSEEIERKSKLKTTLTFKDSISVSFTDDITEQTDSIYRSLSLESNDTDTDTDSSVEIIDEEQQMRNLLPKNYNETESETDDSIDQETKIEISDDGEVSDYDEVFDEEDENLLMVEEPNFKNLPTKEKKSLLRKNKQKNTVNKFIQFQEMRENVLLKTINILYQESQKIKSIHELVQNDFIPKFVQQFLNVEIENVHLNSKNNSHENLVISNVEENNIYAVIEYLKKEEPKFDVLNFNFRNKYLVESSAILFFNTFLNFYFLKNTRQKLFKRCVNILFPLNKKDDINEFRILTKWETYVNLVKFVYNTNKRNLKTNDVFNEAKIPKLFDEKFLRNCTSQKELPFEIYYQLQFIFNAMKNEYKESLIHEYFMVALKKMKETRVPDSEIITASIRAKNISLILQSRTYKKFVKENEKDMKQIANEQDQTQNVPNDQKVVKKDERNLETFLDRLKESSNLISTENEEQFWNPQDNCHSFEDGVLINKNLDNDQSEKEWIKQLTPILGNHQKETIKQEKFGVCELYKFFVYDENEKKWKVNFNDITKFERQKNISIETKTPIILYLNSNEEETISFNSKLNNKKKPKIDPKSDEIYVYGTIDYILEPKNKNNIIPIFLHLHVPKSKEKLENIQRVVISIYSFLYFICDWSIILLNSKTYKSQIDFIELIEIINKSCSAKFLKRKQALNEKRLLLKKQKEFEQNKKFNDGIVDEIFDSDDDDYNFSDDDFDYEIENKEITKAETKDMKMAFILNNFTNQEIKFLKDNQFLNRNLKKVFKTRICAIYPIQSNKQLLNNSLMNELNRCIESNKTTFTEIKEIIQIVDHFKLSNTYISLKRKENWKNELTQIINKRYSMYTKDGQNDINSMLIIPRIEKEINNHLLIDDSEFENQCKAVIFDLNKKNNTNNRQLFKSELEKSATANLQLLNQYKDYDFTIKEKVENMINSHVYFIKDEFFNMIKTISDPKNFNLIYEEFVDILNNRIDIDTQDINDIASLKKDEYQKNIKVTDSNDELDQGTNYCIRESVNVREIKVQIECGKDLKSEFDQDF